MLLSQLFEAIDKRHAAFCFGRMNPPTIGHGQLINTVANSAAGGDYFIFTSQSQDPKKNPLDYATKVKFLKALFPDHASHIVQDPSLKTIMQVAHWLYTKGYRKVTFVAGSDRLADFKELLEKYNGMETANGYYQFDSINFASSGDRDPDAEGVTGVSASAAREAAKAGNYEAFAQATGAGKLTKELYDAVRNGMNISDTLEEGWKEKLAAGALAASLVAGSGYGLYKLNGILQHEKQEFLSQITDPADRAAYEKAVDRMSLAAAKANIGPAYRGIAFQRQYEVAKMRDQMVKKYHIKDKEKVKEDASGYIPKNKREAKDPRWSNALSVDVHPNTPRKNMKALRLV